jgi:hypothetical protein
MMEQRVEASEDEVRMALILLLCPNITRLGVYTDRSRRFKVELLTEMLETGATIRQTDAKIAGVLGSIRPRIPEKVRAVNLRTTSVGDWNASFVTNVLRLPALHMLSVGVDLIWPVPRLRKRLAEAIPRSVVALRLIAREEYDPWGSARGDTHETQLGYMAQTDADVRVLLQHGLYERLAEVTVDYHAYCCWSSPESLDKRLRRIEYRQRDVCDENMARCGWSMVEDYENGTHMLERRLTSRL